MLGEADWPILTMEMPPRIMLLGADYRGLRPQLNVCEGERISAGQILAADRKRAWIRIASPISGRISTIARGPRRSLNNIEIEVSSSPDRIRPGLDLVADRASARQALITAGLWPSIRQRPFDTVADPGVPPKAILVTAMFSDHAAPGLAGLVARDETADDLVSGLQIVSNLAACPTILCHVRGDVPPVPDVANLRLAAFGPDPAERLVGTHVRRIAPASAEAPVWYINWQDVVAIGHFARTGLAPRRRLLCLRGAGLYPPALIRAPVGTPLAAIAAGSGIPGLPEGTGLITGDPLQLECAPAIGRHDDRLSVVNTLPPASRLPKIGRLNRLFQRSTDRTGPIIPHRRLEHSLPGHPAPIAFLRALAAGDVETALRLGCHDLAEADVAACSMACISGNDYSALLRRVLDDLEAA